jgi:hypothetical protein
MNLLKKPDLKYIKRYYFIIILIGYTFFISKNIDRFLENYHQVYSTKPFPNISFSYYIKKNPKIIKKTINDSFEYYYAPDLCFYNKSPCTNYLIEDLKHSNYLGYDFIYIK